MTAGVLQIGVMMSNATKKRIAEIVEQYKQAKGIEDGRVDVHDLAGWALDNKLYQPNMRDEIQLAANTFSRHFREELRADPKGRSYRAKHAVRENINGKQSTLWADLDDSNVSKSSATASSSKPTLMYATTKKAVQYRYP